MALFVVWKWFVETKGKSLEEIDAIFDDGAGAMGVDELADEKKAGNSRVQQERSILDVNAFDDHQDQIKPDPHYKEEHV